MQRVRKKLEHFGFCLLLLTAVLIQSGCGGGPSYDPESPEGQELDAAAAEDATPEGDAP